MKPSCIILIGNMKFFQIIPFTKKLFNLLKVITPLEKLNEKELAQLKPNYVFSFLYPKILKGSLLDKSCCINFHPAPPEYPGRGSASLALYNGDKYYGATAHIMVREVDAGKILLVKRFPILKNETCDNLFERGEEACSELYYEIIEFIKDRNYVYLSGYKWARKAVTKKEFEEWLILNSSNKKDFEKKIKASQHPRFPGPYIKVHGRLFSLVKQ